MRARSVQSDGFAMEGSPVVDESRHMARTPYGDPRVEPGEPPTYLAAPGTRVWRVTHRTMVETEELVFAPTKEQAKKAVNGDGQGIAFDTVGQEPMGPRRFVGIEELPEREASVYWRGEE